MQVELIVFTACTDHKFMVRSCHVLSYPTPAFWAGGERGQIVPKTICGDYFLLGFLSNRALFVTSHSLIEQSSLLLSCYHQLVWQWGRDLRPDRTKSGLQRQLEHGFLRFKALLPLWEASRYVHCGVMFGSNVLYLVRVSHARFCVGQNVIIS